MYFGLFVLGVGAMGYGLFCPHEVKNFPDRVAFISSRLEQTTRHRRLDMVVYAIKHREAVKCLPWLNGRGERRKELRLHCGKFLATIVGRGGDYDELRTYFLENYSAIYGAEEDGDQPSLDTFRNICSTLHRLRNVELPLVRMAVNLLWKAGFALLAVPSTYSLLAVVSILSGGAADGGR